MPTHHSIDVALPAKLDFLRQPASYPDRTTSVVAIETHMSWVFLTDEFAYKLKKPVRTALCDFSTIEQRRRCCEDEVRLNRRLAATVYRGTVALAVNERGHLLLDTLEPSERIVEWLVVMRRLPADRMLDSVIRSHAAEEVAIDAIADLLANFYAQAPSIAMSAPEYVQRIAIDIEATSQALRECASNPFFRLPAALVEAAVVALQQALSRVTSALEGRARAGRIVEGHGDLRPEHVWLGPPPAIIDCIEFSRDLRILDAADDLAFLAMECARLGVPRIGASSSIVTPRPPGMHRRHRSSRSTRAIAR